MQQQESLKTYQQAMSTMGYAYAMYQVFSDLVRYRGYFSLS
ncbi:hypothetical protein [Nostoc sp. MG11]|nr:hypothetical protein [Nostoc sp. MG11]